jgi:DNA-binding MarR family transcriptional regulator
MKGTGMSKGSFIDKASSVISGKSNTLQPSFETESPSNTAAALQKPICPFEPVEIFQQANHRDLLLGAELMQKRRAARATHFPNEMFGEVAWDIMIALYLKEKNHSLSITAISMSIQVPMSTLFRWITYLEIQLLVTTVSVVTDERVRLLQITDMGRNVMDECMTELLQI